MTSATLYREGDDLDALLADLDSQYAGQVRVLSVSYPRDGGVLGFFARQRVGVHYELDGDDSTVTPADFSQDFAAALGRHSRSADRVRVEPDPFNELIEAAEAAEAAALPGTAFRPVDGGPPGSRRVRMTPVPTTSLPTTSP